MKKTNSSFVSSHLLFVVITTAIVFFVLLSSSSVPVFAQQEQQEELLIENDQDVLKNSETTIKKKISPSEEELVIENSNNNKMSASSSSSTITRRAGGPFFRGEPFRLERGPWSVPSPFLFCVYHKDRFPKGYKGTQGIDPVHKKGRQMGSDFSYKDGFSYYHGAQGNNEYIPGFPVHPHRGLSTITITLNNSAFVDHFDSTGAHGRYGRGDAQWMVAGAGPTGTGGIQHSEMFACTDEEKENVLELFQIWIKIPNENARKAIPSYKMFWNEEIPIAKIPVEGKPDVFSEVKVVVGDYPHNLPFKPPTPPKDDYASDPKSQATIYIAQLPCPGAAIKIPPMLTSTAERAVYVYIADDESNCKVNIKPTAAAVQEEEFSTHANGGTIRFRQGVKIAPDCEVSITNEGGSGNIGVLVLGGEPLKEPTVSYGPFVGKDMGEIEEAFASYRRTQFGGWPWDSSSPVHKITDPRMSVPGKGKSVEYPPGYEGPK